MFECATPILYKIVRQGEVKIEFIDCLRSGPGFRLLQVQTGCKWPDLLFAYLSTKEGTEEQPTLVRALADNSHTDNPEHPQAYTSFYIPSLPEGPGKWELFMTKREKYTYHLIYICDPEKDQEWQGKGEKP